MDEDAGPVASGKRAGAQPLSNDSLKIEFSACVHRYTRLNESPRSIDGTNTLLHHYISTNGKSSLIENSCSR